MRVLCVGRHEFLSEHLCRFFRDVGAECEPAVGPADALHRAAAFAPHVVVSDGGAATAALLELWATEPALAGVPVLAVSLTPPPDDAAPESTGGTPVIYLPALDRHQALALLASVRSRGGVRAPAGWPASPPRAPQSAHFR